MSQTLPADIIARAPRRWVHVGLGMRVRVIDQDWIKQQEAIAERNESAASYLATRRAKAKAEAEAVKEEPDAPLPDPGPLVKHGERYRAIDVARHVAFENGVTLEELFSPYRGRGIVTTRQRAMYEVRRLCPHMSLPQIGALFGGRDHSTALWAIQNWPAKAAKLGIECLPIDHGKAAETFDK